MLTRCQVRDPAEYLPLISCLMRKWKSPHYPTGECIGLVGTKSVTVKEVEDCANSDEGSNLLHDFGLKTQALDPPLTFVPWQIFNNVSKTTTHSVADVTLPGVPRVLPGQWTERPHPAPLLHVLQLGGQVRRIRIRIPIGLFHWVEKS